MGLNFRKSVKITDGVKLNIGKKSAGVSVGGKYAGASFNTKSGARVRASLPGTGISYTKSLNSVGKKRKAKKKSKNTISTVLTVVIVLIAVIFLINKNWTKISETLGLDQTTVETTTSQSGATSDTSSGTAISYVINTSTKKIHITTCRYADTTSANIEETSASLEELLADGYSKCGTCME